MTLSNADITGSDTTTDGLVPDPDILLIGPDSCREPAIEADEPVDGVAVMLVGPAIRDPHLLYVSEGLCHLIGWRSDQLIGQSPAFLFSGDEGPRQLEAMRRAVLSTETAPDDAPDLLDLLHDPRIMNGQRISGRAIDHPGGDPDTVIIGTAEGEMVESPETHDTAGLGGEGQGFNGHANGRELNGFGGHDPAQAQGHARTNVDVDTETIDLSTVTVNARYEASTVLVDQAHQKIPVFFTAQAIPSPEAGGSYVVAQFRDLRKSAAERLLADQEAVIASLKRGHHLGQLCHQIAVMIERSLGVSATCWLSIMSPDDELEPVITGGFSSAIVAETTMAVAASSSHHAKRIASVGGLRGELAEGLRGDGVRNLWYVPVLGATDETGEQQDGGDGDGSTLRGAIMVATGDFTPDAEATKLLDHLAQVLAVGIEHATVESDTAYQALHDPLTKLPNRALIMDRLSQAMARLERDSSSISVLLVDIDRFKAVNDMRGIEVGDRVLVEVANRLLAAVRLGDTVGRISSDQYLVMCVATSGELDAAAVARRVLRSLAEPIDVAGDQTLHITASIGAVVVTAAEAELAPAEIISKAESALANATTVGRGQFAMFEAEHQHDVVRRHETEQALRQGIAQNELVLHYQPIVEIKSGFMVGAEALVRWQRPGHGLLPPGQFIDIAEDADLMVPLGEWVINRACEDLAVWPKVKGRSPLVSINLAARHLEVDTLVPTVIRALQRNDLKPNRLGFEITESMAVLDTDAALANLDKLASLGCRIAIDDFGIGHASLDYLRRFSMANALKIDRSFIAGITESPENQAIVKASVSMADALDLQVVAEGVETVEQLLRLRALGCHYAQGFVLSRPMPIDIVLEVWARSRLYGG
ncbi:MAG: bifunctional diguanylate cyclase/phosphodiesterase [Acidimicrobiia bacterium]|nr:bifunctional diguanylate cyclase/phosphodiesterase [Acidimicrobiia bacterium]